MPSEALADRDTGRGRASSPDADRYFVVASPPIDRLFRRVADRQVRSVRLRGTTLRAARRALRLRYPGAELSRQRDVTFHGEPVELWFAYRDGRTEALATSGRWSDQKGWARIVIDASGRFARVDARSRRLLELPSGRIPPLSLADLVSRELGQEICAAFRSLASQPEFAGAVPVRLPNGKWLDIEFAGKSDGPQRVAVSIRTFADRDEANDKEALAQSSLGSMPPVIQRELLRGSTRRKLAPGERLVAPLAEDSWVVLVTAGIVRLFIAADGFEPTILYGNAGSLFGSHAMVAPEPLLVGLQSVTPSVVLRLSARRVEELTGSNRAFGRAVSTNLQLQLQELVRAFAARPAASLRQRLAREIMRLSDLQPSDRLLSVTEQQLADGVGSIRESIGRSIGDLRREGCIATTRHGLLILDKTTLREAGRAGLE
jgi:CRP/FNR family transcriptional regulator, cyclic AMP receptor protein